MISSNSSLQTLSMQPKQDLLALQTDLNSGNITGAQKDFATFQQDALNLSNNPNGKQGSPPTVSSTASTDLQALQSALSSGDVTGAKKALAAFQLDLQSAGKAHKHHGGHHHHSDDDDAKNTATNSQNSSNGTPANGGTGTADTNGINSAAVMASMRSAYQALGSAGTSATGTGIAFTA